MYTQWSHVSRYLSNKTYILFSPQAWPLCIHYAFFSTGGNDTLYGEHYVKRELQFDRKRYQGKRYCTSSRFLDVFSNYRRRHWNGKVFFHPVIHPFVCLSALLSNSSQLAHYVRTTLLQNKDKTLIDKSLISTNEIRKKNL